MNILITGIAGFIGSHLADRFLAEGHRVYGIDNLSTGRRENVANDVHFFFGDITSGPIEGGGLKRALIDAGSIDLLVHCAASYKDPDDWRTDVFTNVFGTNKVIQVAKEARCPIIYMQTALPPVSSYAISKTAGMQYIQQAGVTAAIFRLANIYGPRNLSGPIPTFYKRLMAGEPCTVVDTTRDMVYIDDLVDCVVNAPIKDGDVRVYDVCSGTQTPIADLFAGVEMALGRDRRDVAVVAPAPDEAMTELSIEARVPGWEPVTRLFSGIAKAVDWYDANPPAETFTHLRMEEPTRA